MVDFFLTIAYDVINYISYFTVIYIYILNKENKQGWK